jgi:predicted alpha/beta-hydrolase family hydrolase
VVREALTVTTWPFTKQTRPAGLVLTPGASADRDHHTLVAIDEAIDDLPVLRLTLGTNRVPNAVQKIVAASEAFADELGVSLDRLAYGGRSFGGRSCSVAVAEGLPAAALVLVSYPLHPPGKPDNLRVEHFPEITAPVLFVSGRKDPFGTPDEFEQHVSTISGQTTVEWVDGNHSPKNNAPVIEYVREFLGY